MIYFDHNATTRCDERVSEAMQPYLNSMCGNPSSLYKLGRMARSAIDSARNQVAALVDAEPDQIVFTSGGTEANALALVNAWERGLAISAIEHPSIFENAHHHRRLFRDVQVLPVSASGTVNVDAITATTWQSGDLASLMLANNETGAIQPVATIADLLAERGVAVHTDAVQALGKMPISFRKLGVKLMSLSSHKIYGPKGCGALVVAADYHFRAWQRGGEQESGRRAGTENVAAIVGFGKAAELAKNELDQRIGRVRELRRRLEAELSKVPGVKIFAEHSDRLANTVQFGIAGVNGEMLLMQLDKLNIAVSSGSACSAGSEVISPVLTAMAVEPLYARSAIRVSLGKDNNEAQIDEFIAGLKSALALNREY